MLDFIFNLALFTWFANNWIIIAIGVVIPLIMWSIIISFGKGFDNNGGLSPQEKLRAYFFGFVLFIISCSFTVVLIKYLFK